MCGILARWPPRSPSTSRLCELAHSKPPKGQKQGCPGPSPSHVSRGYRGWGLKTSNPNLVLRSPITTLSLVKPLDMDALLSCHMPVGATCPPLLRSLPSPRPRSAHVCRAAPPDNAASTSGVNTSSEGQRRAAPQPPRPTPAGLKVNGSKVQRLNVVKYQRALLRPEHLNQALSNEAAFER